MADTKGVLKKDRRPGSSSCLSHFPFSRAGAGALAPTSFPALHGPKRGEPAGGGNRGETTPAPAAVAVGIVAEKKEGAGGKGKTGPSIGPTRSGCGDSHSTNRPLE